MSLDLDTESLSLFRKSNTLTKSNVHVATCYLL